MGRLQWGCTRMTGLKAELLQALPSPPASVSVCVLGPPLQGAKKSKDYHSEHLFSALISEWLLPPKLAWLFLDDLFSSHVAILAEGCCRLRTSAAG